MSVLAFLPNLLLVGMDCSGAQRGSSLNISQLSLMPLCSRMFKILADIINSKAELSALHLFCPIKLKASLLPALPCLLDLSFLECPYPCMAAFQPWEPSHHSSVILKLCAAAAHPSPYVYSPCINKDFSALKHVQGEREAVTSTK